MSLGITEILLIACFVLLVFGAKRIPELARALGKASREFKKARDEIDFASEEKADQITASTNDATLMPDNAAAKEVVPPPEQEQPQTNVPK